MTIMSTVFCLCRCSGFPFSTEVGRQVCAVRAMRQTILWECCNGTAVFPGGYCIIFLNANAKTDGFPGRSEKIAQGRTICAIMSTAAYSFWSFYTNISVIRKILLFSMNLPVIRMQRNARASKNMFFAHSDTTPMQKTSVKTGCARSARVIGLTV